MTTPWTRSQPEGPDNSEGAWVERGLLISIQPRFAEAILAGSKSVELRRTVPTLTPGAVAIIYSSSPTKALVGWATVMEILHGSPNALWEVHKSSTGVTSEEFSTYFSGKSEAYALRFAGVNRADNEVNLQALRGFGLEPPQSWRYVDGELTRTLCKAMLNDTDVDATLLTPCADFAKASL